MERFNTEVDGVNDYTQETDSISWIILNILNALKILFSEFFFVIFGIAIDMKLFIFLKNKPRIATAVQVLSRRVQAKRAKRDKESQKRISSMIILNGFNFILLRLPYALVDFNGLLFNMNISKSIHFYKPDLISYLICRGVFSFCESLKSMFYALFLISYIRSGNKTI